MTFDELCLALGPCVEGPDSMLLNSTSDEAPSSHDPDHDPRFKIRNELVNRLTEDMRSYGIEIIGGGISNLLPIDDRLIQRRLENWRTKWQSRIRLVEAARDKKRIEIVDQSRVSVDQALLFTVAKSLSDSITHGEDISEELVAASLVASLERMAENPNIRELLTQDTKNKLHYLRVSGKPLVMPSSEGSNSG